MYLCDMEKQTVFIKVEIDDNHVGVYGMYFTSSGDKVYGVVYLDQSTCLWKCIFTVDDYNDYCYVTHAIKEIELPSEEEIQATDFKPKDCDYREVYREIGFKQGLIFFLNHLKGG